MSGITLSGIEKRFGDVAVVRDLNLAVEPGEFVVLLGESGCGKSTTLRMIAGLDEPTEGTIEIGDADVTFAPPKDRDVAMVFQNYALYPHMNVAQNMSFSLRLQRQPRSEIEARVRRAAEILNIGHLLERRLGELSGGQRQRVAIGRAIVREPAVFLFDEPLSNLDAKLRGHMRAELALLHERLGKTTVYVTHDQVEAMTLASRIVILDDGRIQQAGTPEDVFARPKNLFVAEFIGTPSMNLLRGRIASRDGRPVLEGRAFAIPLPERTGLSAGREVVVGLRPQVLSIASEGASDDAALEMTVDVVEFLGTESVLVGHAPRDPDLALTAVTEGNRHGLQHRTVALAFAEADLHLFDADTGAALPVEGRVHA